MTLYINKHKDKMSMYECVRNKSNIHTSNQQAFFTNVPLNYISRHYLLCRCSWYESHNIRPTPTLRGRKIAWHNKRVYNRRLPIRLDFRCSLVWWLSLHVATNETNQKFLTKSFDLGLDLHKVSCDSKVNLLRMHAGRSYLSKNKLPSSKIQCMYNITTMSPVQMTLAPS